MIPRPNKQLVIGALFAMLVVSCSSTAEDDSGTTTPTTGEGSSNQEIANVLGVSRRTIEAHLRSVYRKLGLSTRVALVLALTERASDRDVGALGHL